MSQMSLALALLLSFAPLGMGSLPQDLCSVYDFFPTMGATCTANAGDKLKISIDRPEVSKCKPNRGGVYHVEFTYTSAADGQEKGASEVGGPVKVGDGWASVLSFDTGISYSSIKAGTKVNVHVHAENVTYLGQLYRNHNFIWNGSSSAVLPLEDMITQYANRQYVASWSIIGAKLDVVALAHALVWML
ncbi:hypothetical protein PG994_012838 [Apiospora phragmitis]|uniref:Uncharacterized protein n=1 Tax=Apiospora phragmitis TaxID=2905665 RepID=A0ABR1T6X7_9PEZI